MEKTESEVDIRDVAAKLSEEEREVVAQKFYMLQDEYGAQIFFVFLGFLWLPYIDFSLWLPWVALVYICIANTAIISVINDDMRKTIKELKVAPRPKATLWQILRTIPKSIFASRLTVLLLILGVYHWWPV